MKLPNQQAQATHNPKKADTNISVERVGQKRAPIVGVISEAGFRYND